MSDARRPKDLGWVAVPGAVRAVLLGVLVVGLRDGGLPY